MSDELSPKERAVLLALLVHGPTLSNSKKETFRLRVAARDRDRLNALGLIVSVRKAAYEHRLTEAGRQRCLAELVSGLARAGDSPLERALYSVLVAVRGKVDLPAMFAQTPPKDAEVALRAAYKELRKQARGGVSLADLLSEIHTALYI